MRPRQSLKNKSPIPAERIMGMSRTSREHRCRHDSFASRKSLSNLLLGRKGTTKNLRVGLTINVYQRGKRAEASKNLVMWKGNRRHTGLVSVLADWNDVCTLAQRYPS